MPERGRFQGMLAVARFNWPFYATAFVVLLAALWLSLTSGSWWLRAPALTATAGCLWFLLGSLGVSHRVYDHSDLYRWKWLDRALGNRTPESIVLCHSGFDEVSAALRTRFPASQWTVLDHYDKATMSEPSIQRARALYPPLEGTISAKFDAWPEVKADAIFGLLAIHELRTETERTRWFSEARRSLSPDGQVILAEHVRDLANFIAFGPGFLHFHSVAGWQRSWEPAGLKLADRFRITPFVRIFVLRPS